MARYLAIDYGHKRCGLAVSDPTFLIAQKSKTVHFISLQKFITELRQIIEEYQISKIILGLPLNLKGEDPEKTREVRRIADIGLPGISNLEDAELPAFFRRNIRSLIAVPSIHETLAKYAERR